LIEANVLPLSQTANHGKEERGTYPIVNDASCWQSVLCSMCEWMGDGRALCLLRNELRLCIRFLWGHALFIVPSESVIPMVACIRGQHTFKPSSNDLSQI